MSLNLCKLCLFKSEPLDEICMEESQLLDQIIEEIFHHTVSRLWLYKNVLFSWLSIFRGRPVRFFVFGKSTSAINFSVLNSKKSIKSLI